MGTRLNRIDTLLAKTPEGCARMITLKVRLAKEDDLSYAFSSNTSAKNLSLQMINVFRRIINQNDVVDEKFLNEIEQHIKKS